MDIILYNLSWMSLNLYLALLPVIFSQFLFYMPNKLTQYIVGLLWLLYLPNAIYVFTDLHHLVEQWGQVVGFEKVLLVLEYGVLEIIGLAFFLVGFYPIEILLRRIKFSEKNIIYVLIGINMVMGFVLTLGKIQRVNSWDVFTKPLFVIGSTLQLIGSLEFIVLSILFGLFANFFYFLLRDRTKKVYTEYNNLHIFFKNKKKRT